MIGRFLGAIQFLTVAPVRRSVSPPGESAAFFPLVGAALGAGGGLVLYFSQALLPQAISSLIVLSFWVLVTGGLHEDGFADVADAFRAGRPREKILAILKDSRIGAHGAIALILISLVRWQALSGITANAVLPFSGNICGLASFRWCYWHGSHHLQEADWASNSRAL